MGKIKRDKNSKNTSGKKGKSETTKRKAAEKKKSSGEEGTRKYGYISANSVIIMAEAAGFSGIPEDVARNLAEDVTYRLRYLIQQCKKYMIHSRQKKLCSADINEVLKMCDAPALYGYTVEDPLYNLIYIKDADIFVLDDELIDLPAFALSEIMVQPKSPLKLSGVWLKPEDSPIIPEAKSKSDETRNNNVDVPNNSENVKHGSRSSSHHENQKVATDNVQSETKISTSLIKYYGITCNTILGHSDLKMVFQDLSSNYKILPIIPYLLNFITIAVNKLGSERQIKRLLQTVEALSRNKKIDFAPYSGTTRVINALLLIVAMDKKPTKISFDFHLRFYAARVLSVVLSEWCCRDEQKTIVVKKMGRLLSDFKISLKIHYGAICLLTALGPEALTASLWNDLKSYLENLEILKRNKDHKSETDIAMLEEALLIAADVMYRYYYSKEQSEDSHMCELDFVLFEYFGDKLCNIRPKNSFISTDPFLDRYLEETTENSEGIIKRGKKCARVPKHVNSLQKPKTKGFKAENVFSLPKVRKRKNTRIIFKFAGAIPVPEFNLKRRKLDSHCSRFIVNEKSKGHVIAGKCPKPIPYRFNPNLRLHVGQIFSIL